MEIKKQNLSKITIKNSAYSLSCALISKIGGLIFAAIIARILLPELFGIYTLVMSVVVIATTFTDLGIETASTRYISDALGKNNPGKARAYFRYIFKIKLLLILLAIFLVLGLAKYLSYNVFDKPFVFFPLIFACFYILIESLRGFFMSLFLAIKDLRPTPLLGVAQQISKIFFSLFAIVLLAPQFRIQGIFVAFGLSGILSLILSLILLTKKNRGLFFGKKESIERPKVLKYVGFMGVASLSLIFFASIDTLMLGRFVEASYISYYGVALSLVFSISALLSISGIMIPVFTQIHKNRLKRGFKKTFNYLLMFSIPIFFGFIFVSKYLIHAIYGPAYSTAAFASYILALLIVTAPLINLYSTLFSAKEKAKELSKLIFIALIINIVLNYFLIKTFLGISQEYAIMGAALATLISRSFLLISLSSKANTNFKISIKGSSLSKFLLASVAMSFFLVLFNHFVNLNLFLGIIEIVLGAVIYFTVLILIKGIGKEDFELLRSLIKK